MSIDVLANNDFLAFQKKKSNHKIDCTLENSETSEVPEAEVEIRHSRFAMHAD